MAAAVLTSIRSGATSRSMADTGMSSAAQIEASSSEDASFCPRSTSDR